MLTKIFLKILLKFFVVNIFIGSVIIELSQTTATTIADKYFDSESLDLGCLSYTVYPPSGTIIQNSNQFEIIVEFNRDNIQIKSRSGIDLLISLLTDGNLLDSILNTHDNIPMFSIWDKSTNKTFTPISSTTRNSSNRIILSFMNLPNNSNVLYFQNGMGISSGVIYLGSRSINVYSTNGVSPPKLDVNPFFSSCPISKKSIPIWEYDNPSNAKLFPESLKVELCTPLISNKICKSSTQKYYYSLVLPVSIAKGLLSTSVNSLTFQNFKYQFKQLPIEIEINKDISVVIPLNYQRIYSPAYEVQVTQYESVESYSDLYGIHPLTLDKYISQFNQGIFNQVFYSLDSFDKINLFKMNSTVNSNYLLLNYINYNFIFSSSTNVNVKDIYIRTTSIGPYEYFTEFIKCAPNSLRNSFTVNYGSNTFHRLGYLDTFSAYELNIDSIQFKRDLSINFGGDKINFQLSNSNSSSGDIKFTTDGMIGVSIDFGVNINQYSSLGNSILLTKTLSPALNTSLLLPKQSFGESVDQIGFSPAAWYSQVGFCNSEHGTNVKNQIQNYVQNGGYTLNSVIPNWINVGGTNRTNINNAVNSNSYLEMKYNSNQAIFKMLISSFEFLEPKIQSSDLHVIGVPGTTVGKECQGQFQVEILNFGQVDSMVHFDINCIQDVYIEVLNYAQTIPASQKRIFYVNVNIKKYYKSNSLECQVSMWIDKQPLWSNDFKSLLKNETIPIFNGCNIPDPCLGINSEPIISKTVSQIQFTPWRSFENFLNSIDITISINNIGNSTGNFISTIECQVSNMPGINANYFFLDNVNYVITNSLASGKSSYVTFTLYGESSNVNGLQLTCTIVSKLYEPNKLCWLHFNDEMVVKVINLQYPYDKCVTHRNVEPLIEYSFEEYSNGLANTYYSFIDNWIYNSTTPNNPPTKHPLKIPYGNTIYNGSIRWNQFEIDKIYQSKSVFYIKNGGLDRGQFTITLGNCDSQLILKDSNVPRILNIASGRSTSFDYSFTSYGTNIRGYSVGCNLSIEIQMEECFSKLGKSFIQYPILIFPSFQKCAGNWLEPSLYFNLLYWENQINNGGSINLEFDLIGNNYLQKSNWKIQQQQQSGDNGTNKLYYQDLSIRVINKEFGTGEVYSNLICSIDTLVINNTLKSHCYLSENNHCFINWRLISSPTLPSTVETDLINCKITIWIQDLIQPSDSCWSTFGKSIVSTFNLTKLIDPCIPDTFNEVFIKSTIVNENSLKIYPNDWKLQYYGIDGDDGSIYFKADYFKNNTNLIYYAYKSIMIKNQGNGIGIVNTITTINNPSVVLISNSSTLKCEIQPTSYCTFTYLFSLIPSSFSDSSFENNTFYNELKIDITFNVEPKNCWSTVDKEISVTITSNLPTLPCGWDPSSPTNISTLYIEPPQVSLIYPINSISFETDYPLNLKFSKWVQINVDEKGIIDPIGDYHYFSINLTGFNYNYGDVGGVVAYDIKCNENSFDGDKLPSFIIEENQLVSYIPVGNFSDFYFTINIEENRPLLSNKQSNIICTVTSIVNLEKCWNNKGKSITQSISIPFLNQISNNSTATGDNDKIILLLTLIPIGLIIFGILIYLLIKYHKLLIDIFNQFKFKKYQDKLINPQLVDSIITTTATTVITNNDDVNIVPPVITSIKCGCGENNTIYQCDKCPKLISNYCESTQCKNFIHSTTLDNISHQHEPQLIVYHDPRDTWTSNYKFKSDDSNVKDLISNELNKFN